MENEPMCNSSTSVHESESTSPRCPPPPSITDVFADHLIQKARTNLKMEQSVNIKTKKEQHEMAVAAAVSDASADLTETPAKSADDFDIPTISEIAENAVSKVNRRKEISALADLQRKINHAKRQLKALGSDESEDEDFINIKDDGEEEEELVANEDGTNEPQKKSGQKTSVASKKSTTKDDTEEDNNLTAAAPSSLSSSNKPNRIPITFREEQRPRDVDSSSRSSPPAKKRSIMERLGVRPGATRSSENTISLSAHRRVEKEIYVPVFRRKEDDRKLSDRDNRVSERLPAKSSKETTVRDLRDRVNKDSRFSRDSARDTRKHKESVVNKDDVISKKRLVESRVIVAPPRPEYDEDIVEVPVNSVVKVQPRPVVPTNKQASKNLLLRAVAEAQKSTALVKPRSETCRSKSAVISSDRSQKLYTKSFRDKKNLLHKGKQNIVIEVSTTNSPTTRMRYENDDIDDGNELSIIEDEQRIHYVAHGQSEDDDDADDAGYVYIPLNISSGNSDKDMKG